MISFATNLAAPFFALYMLRDLNFSYITYIVIVSSNAVSNIAFQTFWGRRADRYGNIKIVRTTSCLMPFIPLLWLVSSNVFFLIGAEIYSGFIWSGFSLSSTNFVYDASDRENRTKHIALFNAMTGVAICAGALLGGFLAPRMPALLGYNLRTMFMISGIARGLVVAFLLRRVTETRYVPELNMIKVIFGRLVRPAFENKQTKKEYSGLPGRKTK